MDEIKECISAINQSIHCPICLDNINNPVVTPCNHSFCRFCIMEDFKSKAMIPCPVCKSKILRRGLKSSEKMTEIASLINSLCEAYEADTGKPFECSTKPLKLLNLSDELSQQPLVPEAVKPGNLKVSGPLFKEPKTTPSPARSKSRPAVLMGTSARKQRSQKKQEDGIHHVKRGLSSCQTTSALLDNRVKNVDLVQTPSCTDLFSMTQENAIDSNDHIEILSQKTESSNDNQMSSNSLTRKSSTRKLFNRLLGRGQKDSKSDLKEDKQKIPTKRNAIRTVPKRLSKDVISNPIAISSEEPFQATQEAIDRLNQEIHSAEKHPLKIVDEDKDDSTSTARDLRKRKALSSKDFSDSKRRNVSNGSCVSYSSEKDNGMCHLTGVRETVYQVQINTPAKNVLNKRFTRSTMNYVLPGCDAVLTPGNTAKSDNIDVNDVKNQSITKTPRKSLNQSIQNSVSQTASKKLKKKYSLGSLFHSTRTPKHNPKSPGWSHVQLMKKDMVSGKPPILKIKTGKSSGLLTYTQVSVKKKSERTSSTSKDNIFKRKVNALLKRNSSKHLNRHVSDDDDDNAEPISEDPNDVTVILETEAFVSPTKCKPQKHNITKPVLRRLIDVPSKITRSSRAKSIVSESSEKPNSKYKSTPDLPISQGATNANHNSNFDSASLSMIPDTEMQSEICTQNSLPSKGSQKTASTVLSNWSKNAIRRTCSFLLPKLRSSGSSKRSITSCVGSSMANISMNSSFRRLSDPEPCQEHLHCSACGETISLDAGNFTRCTGIDLSTLDNDSVYDPVAEDTHFSIDTLNESMPMEMIPDTLAPSTQNMLEPTQVSLLEIQTGARDVSLSNKQMAEPEHDLNNAESDEEEEIVQNTANSRMVLVEDSEDLLDRSRLNSHSELMNTEAKIQLENECAELEANVASLERQLEEAALSPETVKRLLSTAVDTCSFIDDAEEELESAITKTLPSSLSNQPVASGISHNVHPLASEPDMIPSSQENFDYESGTCTEISDNFSHTELPKRTFTTTINNKSAESHNNRKITQFFSDNNSKEAVVTSKPPHVQSRHPAALLAQTIMHSSQTSQTPVVVNTSKSLTTRRMSITGSGLNQEELVKLQKFCRMFNADFDARFIVLKTTHVIMKEEIDVRRAVQRTLKYFLGILSKAWIVNFEWVKGSLFASTLLNESNYEILGDIACDVNANGPCLSRTTPGYLFSNLCLCPIGRLGLLSTQDFENLVEAGAGQFVPTPDTFPSVTSRRKLIVANRTDDDFSMDACREIFTRFGVMIIHVDWILDSISFARRQPLQKKYLIYAISMSNSLE